MPTLTFKVTDAEDAAIRNAARGKRVNLSEYLRTVAKPQEKPGPPPHKPERHPISGLWHNAAPGQPDYNLEELKEALADFP